jgi:hypothetical protein
MAIPDGYRTNFETLLLAASNGDLALVECTDAATGKMVVAICAINHDPDGETFGIAPLAKLFDGNPYEELNPPTIDMETDDGQPDVSDQA